MQFKIRSPNGVAIVRVQDSTTIEQLRQSISEKTRLSSFELLSGYPPKILELDKFDNQTSIARSGLKLGGQQLIARRPETVLALVQPSVPCTVAPSPTVQVTTLASARISELRSDARDTEPPSGLRRKSYDTTAPPEVFVPTHNGTLVLRIMPDDNSCMWRALGAAVLGYKLDGVTELRSLVASCIQANPNVYTAATLGKNPDDYCAWIQRDDSWGGYVELQILAEQFDIEICSFSVKEGRIDKFNEGRPTRCILIYSGIHYDVLALSPCGLAYTNAGVSDDLDVKVFDSADHSLLEKAQELCAILRTRHYYTDPAVFDIRCNRCSWSGKGEKSATAHANATGHMDFAEA